MVNTLEDGLSSHQRRDLRTARARLGGFVIAYAAGRARARWTTQARVMVAAFAGGIVILFAVFHVILFPGALLIYLLYDAVKPRRGIAVLPAGVAEIKLSAWNGAPLSTIVTLPHDALFPPTLVHDEHGAGIRFGIETIGIGDADLARLRSSVPDPSAPGVPPRPDRSFSEERGIGERMPRWREPTVLTVVGHMVLGVVIWLGVLIIGFSVAGIAHRDTADATPSAALMWLSFLLTEVGWLAFVYHRAVRNVRLLVLTGALASAVIVVSIAVIAGSPLGHL